MKFRWSHFIFFSSGVFSITIGYLARRNQLESGYASVGKTSVHIKTTVRGTAGRPVKNARISVFDPTQITLGKTDNNGYFETVASLTSGKSVILQADGIAFQMRRDILVPRALSYQTSVFFDLAEVHEGNATLLSTANAQSTALMLKPTPVPAKPKLKTNFSGLNRSPEFVMNLENEVSNASLKSHSSESYGLTCKTIEVIPEIHHCVKSHKDNIVYSFLMKTLPNTADEIDAWVSEVVKLNYDALPEELSLNERVFVIRHGGHKVEGFIDGIPLLLWKEKRTSKIYRPDLKFDHLSKRKVELTVITETGQVFQRQINWPPRKKVIITRIPKSASTQLSKR